MHSPNNPQGAPAQAPTLESSPTPVSVAVGSLRIDRYTLHYGGGRKPLALVIPDPMFPDMWRVWTDGRLSDRANLSRPKDAAVLIATRTVPDSNWRPFRWRIDQPNSPAAPEAAP
jgi:hypothetical protein